MKKLIFSVICAAALLLTGCKDDDTAVAVEGGRVSLDTVGVVITMPDSWSVLSGDALYEQMAQMTSYAGGTAEELRAACEESGMSYYAHGTATDASVMAVVSSMDMTPDEEGAAQTSLADYARSVHDSTIFEYLASGYKTGEDSSFSEAEYGGKEGYLSCFEVFTADQQPEFVLGFAEYFFQQDSLIYTVQVCYFDQARKDEAMSVMEDMKAV